MNNTTVDYISELLNLKTINQHLFLNEIVKTYNNFIVMEYWDSTELSHKLSSLQVVFSDANNQQTFHIMSESGNITYRCDNSDGEYCWKHFE